MIEKRKRKEVWESEWKKVLYRGKGMILRRELMERILSGWRLKIVRMVRYL